jgi:hypothetical protein
MGDFFHQFFGRIVRCTSSIFIGCDTESDGDDEKEEMACEIELVREIEM